jgi:hypothetical protein
MTSDMVSVSPWLLAAKPILEIFVTSFFFVGLFPGEARVNHFTAQRLYAATS